VRMPVSGLAAAWDPRRGSGPVVASRRCAIRFMPPLRLAEVGMAGGGVPANVEVGSRSFGILNFVESFGGGWKVPAVGEVVARTAFLMSARRRSLDLSSLSLLLLILSKLERGKGERSGSRPHCPRTGRRRKREGGRSISCFQRSGLCILAFYQVRRSRCLV
jgi:hypothetical protein